MCKDEKSYSLSSMKQTYSALRFLYIQALKKPFPQNINFYFRSEERLPEVLSTEEVNRIFSKVNNIKHKAILMTIYSAGLRISELLNLKVREIDFDRNTIRISSAKGKKDRLVMLSQRLVPVLKKYLEQYQPIEYLIEGQKGGIYSPSSVRQIFIKAVSKAGINKKVTVHTLRHSFATHLLDRGTDIRYIQELLGHKKLETTQIYTHISKKSILEIKSPLDTI
ncbi:tyrosine-type recombinase/integrase [bacterium]|nr:tyrosine-type recombinase/integrase [bacterium]